MNVSPTLAVIGGSGIESMSGFGELEAVTLTTPYGAPSAAILRGRVGETPLLFLPRHGSRHELAPHELNSRANICALKSLGATHVVSLSAVGSMRETIRPGDVVVVDQYIDWTRLRPSTFFEGGIVAHVSMAEPVCPVLARAASEAAARCGAVVHGRGTYLCMEGPHFSTRAESQLYRSWNIDVIGMTALPEAKLAREAELSYVTLAFATDYDCWHQSEEPVTVEAIRAVLSRNAELARAIVAELARSVAALDPSPAHHALTGAIISSPQDPASAASKRLAWLLAGRSS